MNFKHFINHLQSKHESIGDFESAIRERATEMKVSKGQVLLFPGEVCKYLYFICNGFFRLYQEVDEQEITIDFAGEHEFITSLESFFSQRKGIDGLVCENDAAVFRISYYDWLALEAHSEIFLQLSKIILQEYLKLFCMERNIYRISNATQKYQYLCERYPKLSNEVSQKHIASYLGITEQSMSFIRKNLLRQS